MGSKVSSIKNVGCLFGRIIWYWSTFPDDRPLEVAEYNVSSSVDENCYPGVGSPRERENIDVPTL